MTGANFEFATTAALTGRVSTPRWPLVEPSDGSSRTRTLKTKREIYQRLYGHRGLIARSVDPYGLGPVLDVDQTFEQMVHAVFRVTQPRRAMLRDYCCSAFRELVELARYRLWDAEHAAGKPFSIILEGLEPELYLTSAAGNLIAHHRWLDGGNPDALPPQATLAAMRDYLIERLELIRLYRDFLVATPRRLAGGYDSPGPLHRLERSLGWERMIKALLNEINEQLMGCLHAEAMAPRRTPPKLMLVR